MLSSLSQPLESRLPLKLFGIGIISSAVSALGIVGLLSSAVSALGSGCLFSSAVSFRRCALIAAGARFLAVMVSSADGRSFARSPILSAHALFRVMRRSARDLVVLAGRFFHIFVFFRIARFGSAGCAVFNGSFILYIFIVNLSFLLAFNKRAVFAAVKHGRFLLISGFIINLPGGASNGNKQQCQ